MSNLQLFNGTEIVNLGSSGGERLTPNFNEIIHTKLTGSVIEADTTIIEAEGEGELLSLGLSIRIKHGSTYNFDFSVFIDDVEYRFIENMTNNDSSYASTFIVKIPLKHKNAPIRPSAEYGYVILDSSADNVYTLNWGDSSFNRVMPKENATVTRAYRASGSIALHINNTDAFNFKKSIKIVNNAQLTYSDSSSYYPTLVATVGLY